MADIAWFVTVVMKGNFRHISAFRHVSLLRFLTFGCDYLWKGLPNVNDKFVVSSDQMEPSYSEKDFFEIAFLCRSRPIWREALGTLL